VTSRPAPSGTHDYRGAFGADGTRVVRRKEIPEVTAERGTVVEDPGSGFCGAVVRVDVREVTLEDRHGRHRVFPLRPAAFLVDGRPATLVPPAAAPAGPRLSASGSVKVANRTARTARASRIWVEGVHDAALVETVWGHDLRVEGIVVEPMHGMDDLAAAVAEFGPAPHRRLGVLVDHLVEGSKETRAARAVVGPNVLIVGHPYVDVWQAVKAGRLGLAAWPSVPRGVSWKAGICQALGWPHRTQADLAAGWRRILAAVDSYADLEPSLLGRVEELIDFVTAERSG